MKRRSFLRSAGLCVAGGALPQAGLRAQTAPADRFAKYRGQTVVISIPAHPHYDAMQKLLPQFTKETGIKVEVDKLQILRMKDKQLLEMAKPQGDYDLISYVVMWKTEYASKKLIRELEPMLNDPALADPAFDLDDIVPVYRDNIGLVGGPRGYLPGPGARLYGLPYGAETSILGYRRDVFERLGLQPPQTYGQLRALLPVLKDRSGIGALTSRGQAGHQCVHAWLLHLNPLGGRVFTDDWQPRFGDEPGVQALTLLKEIVDTGPAGIPAYGQGEMMTAFLQGQAAMYLDSTILFGQVEDPARSRVAGKVGFALHPEGVRRSSQSGGLGLAIPVNARHPEAAFLLMQWLTGKRQDKAVAALGGVPVRSSTLADPELVRSHPEYPLVREQLRFSDPDWRPIIAQWDEINVQALGVGISEALTGRKSPREALDGQVPKVADIMRRGGYLKG